MTTKRIQLFWLISVLVVILTAAVPALGEPALSQDPSKPDIHLTFVVENDRSNSILLEVAVNPILDLLIGPALSLIGEQFSGEETSLFEITETVRGGRTYSALILRFDSLDDLNSFVNTPNSITQILGPLAPGAAVPTLFSTFEIRYDGDASPPTYWVRARMEEGTTSLLGFTNFTVHVRLPVAADDSGASYKRDGELSWVLEPGTPLIMDVTGSERSIGGVSLGSESQFRIILVIIGAVVLLILIVIVVLILRRRSQPQEYDMWDDWQ